MLFHNFNSSFYIELLLRSAVCDQSGSNNSQTCDQSNLPRLIDGIRRARIRVEDSQNGSKSCPIDFRKTIWSISQLNN